MKFLHGGGTSSGATGGTAPTAWEQNLHAELTAFGGVLTRLIQWIESTNPHAGSQGTDQTSGTGVGASGGLNGIVDNLKNLLASLKPPGHGG